MTAAILTRLPLEAGGAVLAVTGRAVHSALAWGFAHYMKAPLASTAIAAMVTLSLTATSNALFFQHTRHPAPLFSASEGGIDPTVAPVVPAPRPVTKKVAVTSQVVTPRAEVPRVETTASVPASDTPIGNKEVFELQRKLEALKLFNGTVDGYYGPQTAGAIRAFEQKAGLKPMGQLTPEIVKAILDAPLISAEPEPRQLPQVEPVPTADPLPKVQVAPVVQPEPVAQAEPMPKPLPQVEALVEPTPKEEPRFDVKPLAANKPLTRDLPDSPQEAMNIAVETAGDAIDTIINGVQTLAMTNKPEPKPKVQAQAAPATLQFASQPAATPAVQPIVTASVAAVPVVSPRAAASTEVRVRPQEVPVLDTDAKPEELQGFSVTDPGTVSKVQRGLSSLGFLHGPVDGVAGEATAKAIRSFETFYNYERTGRITAELPDLLVKAGATL